VPYLHGYHEVAPPIALIAPIARVARSTNRYTPHRSDHRMPTTERYLRPADQRVPAPVGTRPLEESYGFRQRLSHEFLKPLAIA